MRIGTLLSLTRKRVFLPSPFGYKGEIHSFEWGGGSNSDEGTDTLVLYVQSTYIISIRGELYNRE